MAITTTHYEMHFSPQSRWVRGEFDGWRTFMVPWNSRDEFIIEIGTYPEWTWNGAEGPSDALAYRVDIRPYPNTKQKAALGSSYSTYDWALIRVAYSTRGPKFTDGYSVEEWITPAASGKSILPGSKTWNDGETLVSTTNSHLVKEIHGGTFHQKRSRLTAVQVPSNLYTNIGSVNSNAVTPKLLPVGFAAGQLLYVTPYVHAEFAWDSGLVYTVEYRYKIHANNWNKHWNPETAQYEFVKHASGNIYYHYPVVAF